MINYFTYLLEVSICLVILFLPYSLYFRRLTHFQWNRAYLLGVLVISAIIPVIEIPSSTIHEPIEIGLEMYLDNIGFENFSNRAGDEKIIEKSVSMRYEWIIVASIYVLGMLFTLIKLLIGFFRLYSIIKNNPNEEKYGFVWVKVPESIAPCSFGKWLFLSPSALDNRQIVKHELVHLKQKHTYDILLIECYSIFFWFNPVIHIIRKGLKQVHEYVADHYTAYNDKKSYAQLILESTTVSSDLQITNSFSFLPLKNRILMLSKKRSSNLSRCGFMFTLPIIILLATAFSKNIIPDEKTLISKKSYHVPLFNLPIYQNKEIHLSTNLNNPQPFILPIAKEHVRVTFKYGMRNHPILKVRRMHTGIDFKAPEGTPILAVASGIITSTEKSDKGYGNRVIIDHDNGLVTSYAHMKGIDVREGEQVKQGKMIGTVGSTGLSIHPHLHFEVIKENKKMDPEGMLPKLDME
ncbi:MAG: M23/M56 family metallopeptidase [Bacteroidota bacterium]